jgi:GT2 family glycosyltransferase
MTTLSLISVTYHTGESLFTMIDSVLAQPQVAELILVDNGNPEAARAKIAAIAAQEPRIKIISGHGNIGFGAGCNKGANVASQPIIFFLNPDSELPPDFFTPVLAAFSTCARPALLSPRIVDAQDKEQSGSRRALLTPWLSFVEVFHLYAFMPAGFKRFKWHEDPLPDGMIEVPATSGAAMMLYKDDFMIIGGFDEGYFLHAEDLDLCLRIAQAGGHVYFLPSPAVRHIGATSTVTNTFVDYHKARSFVRYFFKNYKDKTNPILLYALAAATWARFVVQWCIAKIRRL